MNIIRTPILTAVLVGACVVASAAHAQKSGGGSSTGSTSPADGVINIDQAKAMAGSVTANDSAGFPVTITQPGSYRLTGNLIVPAGFGGIEIVANGDVTLDLNGFTIAGPVSCTANSAEPTVVCNQAAQTTGVLTGMQSGLVISNGTVSGFGSGVHAGRDLRVTNVTARSNSIAGISFNTFFAVAVLDRVQATLNGVTGVVCGNGIIINSGFSLNGTASSAGMQSLACTVIDSAFLHNKGFAISGSTQVRGSRFFGNGAIKGPGVLSTGGNVDAANNTLF